MNSERQYIELYTRQRELICRHSAAPMNAVREQAFADFCRVGFPSRKVERYKYTDIPALFAPDYGLNLNRFDIAVDPYEAFRCDVPNLSTSLYFMINDAFYHTPHVASPLNRENGTQFPLRGGTGSLPPGVIVGSLREQAEKNPALIGKYYAGIAATDDAVTALNTMLAQDGLFVYVPRNVKVDRAIQIINILKSPFVKKEQSPAPSLSETSGDVPPSGTSGDVSTHREVQGGLMLNRRVLIIAEDGAEVKLLFCDHTADDAHFLTTQVIEAYVGNNASLDLYCLEETHAKNVRVSNVYIDQQCDSRVNHNVITLHNGITRNRLDLTFSGEGAECGCYGCVIADKQQHVDNNTLITHRVPHCTSTELYKYVLNDHATGAFAGRVLVEPGAQQTASQMTNQNLCGSQSARMYTQPMLEIYADDVKCAHGSTVGQLGDDALFYMRQRGISEHEARILLQQAFINEVIGHIQLTPLRDRLHYLVEKRFRGELSKCEGCKLCK